MAALRRSPYHHRFVALGAQFVERIGFAAPFVFSSVADEHRATRERVGLFDVYYQVAVEVAGPDAAATLHEALVGDVLGQPVGRVLYASPCNEQGGMVDDLTCFRLAPDRFWLVPTPSRVEIVVALLRAAAAGRHAAVTNLGYRNAFLSVQGPRSRELLQAITAADLTGLRYFHLIETSVADVPGTVVSRTGYNGELGYELFFPSEYAEHMLDTVLDAGRPLGALPCGLGALRSLRIEKRYPLYGLDLDDTVSPLEAGLGWTVKLDKPAFSGRAALLRQKSEGVARRLVLLLLEPGAALPAVGATVTSDRIAIGRVTSADVGHTVGRTLAMAFVDATHAVDRTEVRVAEQPATVLTRAAYDPDGLRARA